MQRHIPITVYLSEETLREIDDILKFTIYNNKFKDQTKPTDYNIEDFISACINDKLDDIRNYIQLTDYENLGKPYQIKNKFKEFIGRNNLKQKDISELTGIYNSNLSIMFSNKKQPSLDYFMRVWVAFGCPPIHEILYRE